MQVAIAPSPELVAKKAKSTDSAAHNNWLKAYALDIWHGNKEDSGFFTYKERLVIYWRAIINDSPLLLLFLLLAILQISDAITTFSALSQGAVEANPMAAFIFSNTHTYVAFPLKLASIAFFALQAPLLNRRVFWWQLWFSVAIMTIVVVNNMVVMGSLH